MPTRAARIAHDLEQQVEQGQLAAGTRLLSIRDAARAYGVSRNTIVDAYDRLVAAGLLDARRGSGFYVSHRRRPDRATTGHFEEAVDLVSLLREQLNQHHWVRAGDGRPPASWMQTTEINRYLAHGRSGAPEIDEFEYGRPQGYTPLRELVARILCDRSINAHPDQILFTSGANHAFDLLIRHFVEPGDAVLVETPGYYPLFGKLRLQKADIIGISRGASGPDADELDRKARRSGARLFFVQPMAHNPTGTSMDLAAMHQLLRVAERHDLMLIEDAPFADILPPTTPHLAALDALDRVVHIGTFSKTLAPSLRCGYIAANRRLVAPLTDIKMLTLVNSSGLIERIVHDVIASGRYRRHLSRLRKQVEQAAAAAVEQLQAVGIVDLQPPSGGFYLWAPLPARTDDLQLARQAAAEGIFLAPGSLFTPVAEQRLSGLRINVAHGADARLLGFLRRALG